MYVRYRRTCILKYFLTFYLTLDYDNGQQDNYSNGPQDYNNGPPIYNNGPPNYNNGPQYENNRQSDYNRKAILIIMDTFINKEIFLI